ncbi:MAG: SMI1/KNR4 family protein [Desulfobacteraceae bacterium]|nr:SMI1/KNR4 family protein [Desulfobacteraceae bacterium]
MIEIEWENFLSESYLKTATNEMLDKNEKLIGKKLPKSLRSIIMEHGGQKPLNLVPIYPNGSRMSIECIYHAYFEDDKYDGYTIPFGTSALADEDYLNYVAFSYKSNVFLCLDYNVREINPPVVMVIRDSVPDDPKHKHFLADDFNEFLEKYTVPMDEVER